MEWNLGVSSGGALGKGESGRAAASGLERCPGGITMGCLPSLMFHCWTICRVLPTWSWSHRTAILSDQNDAAQTESLCGFGCDLESFEGEALFESSPLQARKENITFCLHHNAKKLPLGCNTCHTFLWGLPIPLHHRKVTEEKPSGY